MSEGTFEAYKDTFVTDGESVTSTYFESIALDLEPIIMPASVTRTIRDQ
jgi:hypothetical protein